MSFWDTISAMIEEAREKTLGKFLEALARGRARRDEAIFSVALIALSAKMAKADGIVTDDEIAAFQEFFEYPEAEATKVRMLYDLAQKDVAGFEHYLAQVKRLFREQSTVLEDVLDCLFYVALADGLAHPREMALLEAAASEFELSDGCFRRIKAAHIGIGEDDPYLILGLTPEAEDSEIKAKYRALMREHHPDALMSRGVPASLIKIAEGRSSAINAAYEQIMLQKAKHATR